MISAGILTRIAGNVLKGAFLVQADLLGKAGHPFRQNIQSLDSQCPRKQAF